MSQILCPYCFTKHKVSSKGNTCPNVKLEHQDKQEEIPDLFVKDYQREKPVWLTAIGFSQHGKTCYMAALSETIENISRVWSKSAYRFLDQRTLDTLQAARQQVISGEMPKSTAVGIPRPIFIRTSNIPKFGTKCLVLYDTAGQLYEKLYRPENEMLLRPIKVTKNIWFFVSLTDLQNTKLRLQDLLTVYLDGMEKLGSSLKGRNLIVVYTKADALIDNPNYDIPKSVSTYVSTDPLQNLRNLSSSKFEDEDFIENYLAKMRKISDDLREFTKAKLIDGNAFINLAEENGMNVYFSIVSALGADPKQGKLNQNTVRYRVLDPYFWALNLNSADENTEVNLVLDGSTKSSSLYDKYDLQDLANTMQEKTDTTTYVLGRIDNVAVGDQALPKKKPDCPRPRLLGPILEQAANDTKFIVLTTGKIHDLEDFSTSAWYQRIFLVSVGMENFHTWPNGFNLHPNDDISLIYDDIEKFLEEK